MQILVQLVWMGPGTAFPTTSLSTLKSDDPWAQHRPPPLTYSTLKSELRPIGPGRRPSGEDLLLKCLSTTGHWVQLPPTPDFPTQAG